MSKNRLAIVGGSELGQQLAKLACLCGFDVVGFFDDFNPKGSSYGYPLLGPTTLLRAGYDARQFDQVAIGIGYKHLQARDRMAQAMIAQNIPLATLVHPSCIVDASATLQAGATLYAGVIVDKNVIVETNTLINLGCILSHDAVIGAHSFICPGVTIAGFTRVGKRVFIGTGATLIDSISVYDDSIIGAGAVVVKTLMEAGTYVGNPARKIK